MIKNHIFIIIILLLCTSCLKEEIPVLKKERGDLQLGQTPIGERYENQTFFKLRTGEITQKKSRFIWDIAFENGEEGNHILLNTSKNMYLYTTDKTELDEVHSSNPYKGSKNFDACSWNLDSTAYGNLNDGFVRIIDAGLTENYTYQEFFKLKVMEVTPEKYVIHFARLSSDDYTTVEIQKSNAEAYSFIYFSLVENQEVEVAPINNQWDFVATQYLTWLYDSSIDDDIPYLVTGILTNRFHSTRAIRIDDRDFDEIDLEYIHSLELLPHADIIGYDWKDLTGGITGNYEVYPGISYVVQDHEGIYYKLRFIDFYDQNGIKGTPIFEFQELGV